MYMYIAKTVAIIIPGSITDDRFAQKKDCATPTIVIRAVDVRTRLAECSL